MGYTNYWTPNKEKLNTIKEFPKEMLDQMRHVAEQYNKGVMIDKTIAGPIIGIELTPTSIVVTGSCEGFEFDLETNSHTNDRIGVDSWKFCKTCREDYDMVVKSFIMILKKYGFITDWSHDDNNRCDTYKRAIKFAKKCGIDIRGLYAKR
jgi:inorganic pyrophosphatase